MDVTVTFKPNEIQHIRIPTDLIICIISKPDKKALEELLIIEENTTKSIPYGKIRNALIPCFNLLMTCKSYYNDRLKKNVQHAIACSLKAPQGIMLFLCPNDIQLELLSHPFKAHQDQTIPLSLLQEEAQAKQLVNLCFTEKEVTNHEVITTAEPLIDRLNDIIYTRAEGKNSLYSQTLVEYLLNKVNYNLLSTGQYHRSHSARVKIFTVIDYLCESKKIDCSIPMALRLNTSVEQYIAQCYKYAKDYLGTKTFNTIALTAANSVYARPPEHPHIISGLASVFLVPSEGKKAFREEVLSTLVDAFRGIAEKQKANFRNNLIKIIVAIILTFTATIITLKRLITQ